MLVGAPITVIFFRNLGGSTGLILGLVSLFLLTTAVAGWDPIYALLRHHSAGPEDAASKR
jgi:hypothetical protein